MLSDGSKQGAVGDRLLERVRSNEPGTPPLHTSFVFEPHSCATRAQSFAIDLDAHVRKSHTSRELELHVLQQQIALVGEPPALRS